MLMSAPTISPPFRCIFCSGSGPFATEEHIVPESLGNDLVVLAKGWVCDSCNNLFSAFESRVLYSSILGAERCRMGVTTKRGKPAHSRTHGISWFAEPTRSPNHATAEADWKKVPLLISRDGSHGKLLFPMHDESNLDIARLLLKIGVEISAPLLLSQVHLQYDLAEAKDYLVRGSGGTWPYFALLDGAASPRLVSVFGCCPEDHGYICACGFDIFLHEVDAQPVLFFRYGEFSAGIALSSRDTAWRSILLEWGVSHVGCPIEFADLSAR